MLMLVWGGRGWGEGGRRDLLRAFRNSWRGRLDVGLWLLAFFIFIFGRKEKKVGRLFGVMGGWVICCGR